jgi:D-tyrosyl-tRNA(Tyr) deacylase
MRTVIQRVRRASVTIAGQVHGSIEQGLLVLVGIEEIDTREEADWLVQKVINLRIFDDAAGVMNKSVREIGGNMLVISQFTLFAQTKKGNRPSYIRAAKHATAIPLYEYFCAQLSAQLDKSIATGIFGADMQVELLNDGPVTIWIDSHQRE